MHGIHSPKGHSGGRVLTAVWRGALFASLAATLFAGAAVGAYVATGNSTQTASVAHPRQLSFTDLPPSGGKGGSGDDYPYKNLAQDSAIDPWHEYVRECTSFVAWALHSRNSFEVPFGSDAINWGPLALALGVKVDSSPAVGSVAWSTNTGGHVAWVSAVNNGVVTIEDYNGLLPDHPGVYNSRSVNPSDSFQYIHFKDLLPASS